MEYSLKLTNTTGEVRYLDLPVVGRRQDGAILFRTPITNLEPATLRLIRFLSTLYWHVWNEIWEAARPAGEHAPCGVVLDVWAMEDPTIE